MEGKRNSNSFSFLRSIFLPFQERNQAFQSASTNIKLLKNSQHCLQLQYQWCNCHPWRFGVLVWFSFAGLFFFFFSKKTFGAHKSGRDLGQRASNSQEKLWMELCYRALPFHSLYRRNHSDVAETDPLSFVGFLKYSKNTTVRHAKITVLFHVREHKTFSIHIHSNSLLSWNKVFIDPLPQTQLLFLIMINIYLRYCEL